MAQTGVTIPSTDGSLALPSADEPKSTSKDYEGGKVVQATTSISPKEQLYNTTNIKDGDEALELLAKLGHTVHDLPRLAATFDDAYYKRLTRKIDLTIMPILAFTYFLQFLDKNVGPTIQY